MPGSGPQPPQYTAEHAETYDELGIVGTTYQVGFDTVARMLGDLKGKNVLDFGSGTGRSSRFLIGLGADKVVGVDHNREMVRKARLNPRDNIAYFEIVRGVIPLSDCSMDAAVSVSVFIEIRTREAMMGVCRELARTLKTGSVAVILSTNPHASGHAFRSFEYGPATASTDTVTATCTIRTARGTFDIEDTLWEESDYVDAIVKGGLDVDEIAYPLATYATSWSTSEATIAPFIVLRATRR